MKSREYVRISEEIAQELNEYFEKYCKKNEVFKKISVDYLKKRVHLNGTQFCAGFKASKSKENPSKYYNIPIILEYIMLRAYRINKILDHKKNVWESEERIEEEVLDIEICLVLILRLLEDSKKILGEKYSFIKDLVLGMVSDVNEGFWLERNFLKIKYCSLSSILKDWNKKYKKRNLLFDRVYDYAPLIGYYLGSNKKDIFQKYENYFKNKEQFSHLGQIINDLSDYYSIHDENVKSYQDAFSDIMNRIITYPTYVLIDEKEILNALENPQITKDLTWREKVIQIINRKGIIEKTKILTKKGYIQNINFWKRIMKVNNELLFHTYSLLLTNKYYIGLLDKSEESRWH